jgi:hypothetical protein
VPGKVPVEVDAMCVPARACGHAVGVQVGNDPEIEIEVVWREVLERSGDGDAAGLVAVDAAHDEHGCPGRVADLVGLDRPALPGAPEQHARVTARGRRPAQQCERCDQGERDRREGRCQCR